MWLTFGKNKKCYKITVKNTHTQLIAMEDKIIRPANVLFS